MEVRPHIGKDKGSSNSLCYLLKAHLGFASVATDPTDAIVGEQRYYPYGETRITSGTIYTDKLYTSLGIHHYQACFYSPCTLITFFFRVKSGVRLISTAF